MATTINSYKVTLALDAADYIRNSALSKGETAALKREINGARTPADNYTRSLNLLDKSLKAGAIDQATYNRLLDSASTKFNSASKVAASLALVVGRLSLAYAALRTVKGIIEDSAKLGAEVETAAISFEVLTGSVQESEDMLRGLKQLAASTPLGFSDTQAAARTMLSFNVETSKILPTLKMLGDITGGNSERFKMLSLAFAQTSAAGRMMGQDLLQMINAGFNPLQEISRKTGESLVDLKKRMEDGAISSEEVAAAFESATAAGGRFFGMTDRLAQTAEGKIAILKDSIDELKRSLGEGLLPILKESVGLLNQIISYSSGQKGFGEIMQDEVGNKGQKYNAMYGYMVTDQEDAMKWTKKSLGIVTQTAAELRDSIATKQGDYNMARPALEAPKPETTAIGSLIDSAIAGIRTGAGGLVDVASAVRESGIGIAYAGMADTKELIAATQEDPAIKSLEVGTQEAYQYLTQATRDAEKQARDEEAKKAQLEENAKKQRDKTNEWLESINDAMENNGFKRFR